MLPDDCKLPTDVNKSIELVIKIEPIVYIISLIVIRCVPVLYR